MLKVVSNFVNSIGALNYKGTWNASTNSPALASGVGTKGDYYVVSVAGGTTIDGESLWGVGDWIVFNGTAWQKVDGGDTGNFTSVVLKGSSTGVNTITTLNAGASNYTATFPAANTSIAIAEQTLTFSGPTAARTITLPDANFSAARIDAGQSFTGNQTFLNTIIGTSGNQIQGFTSYRSSGASASSPGDAAIYYNSATGYTLQARAGSFYDWSLITPGNANYIARNPTGTQDLQFLGAVAVTGALSKGSGSFRIRHPLPEKKQTHDLVHSFVEGPKADLIYRGSVKLQNGQATINIDDVSGMTAGTFVILCREVQCFTTNETGWTAVRGKVVGNVLSIESQQPCDDEVSWMVIGERQDEHMMQTDWTDDQGRVIVEPEKKLADDSSVKQETN